MTTPSLAAELRKRAATAKRPKWPRDDYQRDPVGFAQDVLGFRPWSKQADIMQALATPRARVSAASGHKIGKSCLASGLALWFYASFPRARVVLMAASKVEHVRRVIWRDVNFWLRRAGRCAACLPKDALTSPLTLPCPKCDPLVPWKEGREGIECPWWGDDPARSGLSSPDGREIFAYTARDVDAIGGISGANLLFIFDEASGIPDEIFEAMRGNAAGGARMLLIGNPLRTTGEFYESRHAKRALYVSFTISSEETPNVVQGAPVIPGLADREYIREAEIEWGRGSPLFKARVLGEDPVIEEGQLCPVDVLEEAEARWETIGEERTSHLQLGVDVAFDQDDAAVAATRGRKCLELTSYSSPMSEDALVEHVLDTAARHRYPRERKPRVVYDSSGDAGGRFRAAIARNPRANEVEWHGIPWGSKLAARNGATYHDLRSQAIAHCWDGRPNGSGWIRTGAIPTDRKLEGEVSHTQATRDDKNRLWAVSNDWIKKKIRRSPDRRNAVEYSVWPVLLEDAELPVVTDGSRANAARERPFASPYGAADEGLARLYGGA